MTDTPQMTINIKAENRDARSGNRLSVRREPNGQIWLKQDNDRIVLSPQQAWQLRWALDRCLP